MPDSMGFLGVLEVWLWLFIKYDRLQLQIRTKDNIFFPPLSQKNFPTSDFDAGFTFNCMRTKYFFKKHEAYLATNIFLQHI